MAKKLTVKEAKLVKAKAEGKRHQDAWDEAGYSQNSSEATKIANTQKILKKENVQEALHAELQRQGITLEKAIAPITKGLTATKQNEYTGEITEDIKTQMAASDRALKLMGIGSSEGGSTNFIQIINEKGSAYND